MLGDVMNWFGFLRVIHMIYFSKKLPDLEYIQKQGLLAVKIGQVHALRIDFLDNKKCRHLAQLYRHTVTVPQEETKRLIKKICGRRLYAKLHPF